MAISRTGLRGPEGGNVSEGVAKSLMDALIPSLILELRFKTLRCPLSLFVGFPTALLASLTPETSLGTKWWACSGNPTPS